MTTFEIELTPEQKRRLDAFILDLTHYQRRGLPEPAEGRDGAEIKIAHLAITKLQAVLESIRDDYPRTVEFYEKKHGLKP